MAGLESDHASSQDGDMTEGCLVPPEYLLADFFNVTR